MTSKEIVMAAFVHEQSDGKLYCIDTNYFGNKRNTKNLYSGPFNNPNVRQNDDQGPA